MSCGCCACLSGAGPHIPVQNRPGLSALRYRIGTHGSFLEDMIRRLTIPVEGDAKNFSLHSLTTRETDDPAIAFLDAWATVGDVLTFYQERIANEGFLRTATERRSILELGRLVGYKLKPGVSSSVYLAYTIDPTTKTIIPAGSKSQSTPGADEKPQVFETSEDFEARGVWNALKPRLGKPQKIIVDDVLTLENVWIKGTTTRLNAGDPLLFVFMRAGTPVYAMRRAMKTTIDTENDRTTVTLDPVRPYYLNVYEAAVTALSSEAPEAMPAPLEKKAAKKKKKGPEPEAAILDTPPPQKTALQWIIDHILLGGGRDTLTQFLPWVDDLDEVRDAITKEETDVVITPSTQPWKVSTIVKNLAAPSAIAPKSKWQYSQSLRTSLQPSSDFLPRLVGSFIPQVAGMFHSALAASTAGTVPFAQFQSLHVLRRRSAVFGYNAPTTIFEDSDGLENIPVPDNVVEENSTMYLDSPADAVRGGSYALVQRRQNTLSNDVAPTLVCKVRDVETGTRTAYVISGKTTRLSFNQQWASFPNVNAGNLAIIRPTSVLLESEELPLAQQPVIRPVGEPAAANGGGADEGPTRIDLDAVVEGLEPGRWVIVSGERVDIPGTTGVISSELAMVSTIELHPDSGAGGSAYSTLVLAPEGMKYRYKRSTAKVYANVVKATHGDTRAEILGAGDGAKALQTFTLHQTPLTFVSAPTVDGVQSTLAIRVNDILWHETDTFFGTGAQDRVFVTKTADDGKVSVIFGNGREGSRLPTGPDNVRALYRSGIGKPGNVKANQIATAISRPLGVKDVINPLAASGGADPESRDDARRSIPVSLQAMGRIVSVRDYADFARTFGGINKAIAVEITDGRRQIVHLTIGGSGDSEIDVNSDLYRNLVEALRRFGDPYQPFVVQPREKLVVAGSARVRVHPDYLWTSVGPKVRAKLLDVFSYDRRDFGQVVFPSEAVAAIQGIEGVTYVDLDLFGSIAQDDVIDLGGEKGGFGTPDVQGVNAIVPQLARLEKVLRPAQIAYLPPELADLFILTEIEDEE